MHLRSVRGGATGPPAPRRATNDYTAYGLRVRSALPLPFVPLPDAPGGERGSNSERGSNDEPDVTVRIGRTPRRIGGARGALPRRAGGRWEAAPGAFLRHMGGVARYFVTGGCDILVEPLGHDRDVAAVLTGSIFAALLQQRGVVPFHASAVATEAGAVLFAGSSGAGKSSLLAALLARGYPMLADDVTAVAPDGSGRPEALPAFPRLRLCADALDMPGWRARARDQVYEGVEKYSFPVERFRGEPLAVRAVYVLAARDRDGIEIEASAPAAAFQWLCTYTYRRRYLAALGQRRHFRTAVAVAKQAPVFRVARPSRPFRPDALADRIDAHLQGAPHPDAAP